MKNSTKETLSSNYLTGDSSFIIDTIRVLACEMIVVCHTFLITVNYFNLIKKNTNPLYLLDNFLGNIGVVLFFIVSGIVISNGLLKNMDINNSYNFKSYFIDRFSRIYTGLVPCLIFIYICDNILLAINHEYFYTMSGGIDVWSWLGSLFMLQGLQFPNISPDHGASFRMITNLPAFGEVLWTLNIEWWLYLVFGWMVTHIRRGVKLGILFLIPLLLFSYYPMELFISNSHENLVFVWFMGVATTPLYIYVAKVKLNLRVSYVIIAILLLIIGRIGFVSLFNEFYYSLTKDFYDLTLEVLLAILILLLMVKYQSQNRFDKTKIKSIIKFMSKYSFTLYLTHFIVENMVFGIYITQKWDYPLVFVFVFSIILSNIVAIIIAYPTEMRYKDVAKLLKYKLAVGEFVTRDSVYSLSSKRTLDSSSKNHK